MRKTWKIAILSGVLLAGIGANASADPRVRFSVSFGVPAPVYAPYYPAYPVYYPAQPVYYPPRVVYHRHPHGHRHAHHRHHNHWR